MKFFVTKTSVWSTDVSPCPECERISPESWAVELETLEDLVGFVGRNGITIISDYDPEFPSLEIYDDYRE